MTAVALSPGNGLMRSSPFGNPQPLARLSLLQTVDVERRTKLWRTVDQVNRDFGRESVRLLGSGLRRAWKVRADHRSPRWTTHWEEIPLVKL
jgi:DNA polymerase V